jgi:hypothetical protein
MPGTPTAILGLTVPTVGGDFQSWGPEVNQNWSILDLLGACGVFPVSSAFVVVSGSQFERFYRVTTGGLNVPGTLPDPGTIPPGKVFTIMVADVGGSITLSCINPAVTIQGQTTFLMTNQFAVVRLLANGVNYDVVGVV